MSDGGKFKNDALVRRALKVVDLVEELRAEQARLRGELSRARERIITLEKARSTVRARVERMLQGLGGAA